MTTAVNSTAAIPDPPSFVQKYGAIVVLLMTGVGLIVMQEVKNFQQSSAEEKLQRSLKNVEEWEAKLRAFTEQEIPGMEGVRAESTKQETTLDNDLEAARVLRQRVKQFKKYRELEGAEKQLLRGELSEVFNHDYVGCYADTMEERVMDHFISNTKNKNCMKICRSKGYRYTGYEYGEECWCSNRLPTKSLPKKECNMYCIWNKLVSCGASLRVAVYTPKHCTQYSELSSGYFAPFPSDRQFIYQNKNCAFQAYHGADITRCLGKEKHKKVIIIGGTQGRSMIGWLAASNKIPRNRKPSVSKELLGNTKNIFLKYDTVVDSTDSSETGFLDFYWLESISGYNGSLLNDQVVGQDLLNADAVIVVPGHDDLGQHFCGVRTFYNNLKRLLTDLTDKIGSGTRLHVSQIPQDACGNNRCGGCFTSTKMSLARQGVTLAAACTQTHLISLEKIAPDNATLYAGPVEPYFNTSVISVHNDMLLDVICADAPLASPLPACSEREFIETIVNTPEAFEGCVATEKRNASVCPLQNPPINLQHTYNTRGELIGQ